MDEKTLVIHITNKDKTFTEQLEAIISAINDDCTSGEGWSIGEEKE